jgi:tetratricopeptide (TPR) repeat protein
VDVYGHLGGFIGGALTAAFLEGHIAGVEQVRRDWLRLRIGLAVTALLTLYGAWGVLTTLPREMPLLRAAREKTTAAQVAELNEVLRQRPYFVEARLHLASLLLGIGRDEDAARQYRTALEQHPNDAYVQGRLENLVRKYLERGHRADGAGDAEQALVCYRRAVEFSREPETRAQALNGVAWMLADKLLRDLDEAERAALEAVRLQPEDAAITDTLAWVHYRQGRYQLALQEQLRAIQLGQRPGPLGINQAGELHYHLGAIYEKLGNRLAARDSYVTAIRQRGIYPAAVRALRRLSGIPEEPPERFRTPPRFDPAVQRGII